MTINYVFIPDFSGGGAERLFLNFAKYASSEGVHVKVLTISNEGALSNWCAENGIDSVSLGLKQTRYKWLLLPYVLGNLVKILKRGDRIISAIFYCNLLSILASLIKNITVITSQHTVKSVKDYRLPRSAYYLMRFLTRYVHNAAKYTICVSESIKADLVSNYRIDENKLVVIHNPVAVNVALSPISLFSDFQMLSDTKRILCVGRLIHDKGFDVALNTLKTLLDKGIDVRLDILGDGPLKSELIHLSELLGIEKNVFFHGFVEDTSSFYSSSHVVFIPSRLEGFGNVAVEGLSYGKPVVVSDCPGGLKEIITDSRLGSVEILSANSMADEINYWLTHDDKKLSTYRIESSKRFLPERLFGKYLDLF